MTGMLAMFSMLAATLPGSYDCSIAHQAVIDEGGMHAEQTPVTFSGEDAAAWRFRVNVARGERAETTIDWPADPIQIAGRHLSLPLAPGQIAFAVPARGPCMFTEQACLTLVELSVREDGDLAFSILPAGSLRRENGTRSIFHVVFVGTCRRQGGATR